jgi:hypothetical protein
MLAYNLFRTRDSDVVCAVPEDRPVPPFVHDGTWQFHGRVADESVAPLPRAAQVAVRFNGFYIFHPFESPCTPARPADASQADRERN